MATAYDAGGVCFFDMLVRDEPVNALYKLWRRLVWTYGRLRSSYQEYKLVALSANASRFQSVVKSPFRRGGSPRCKCVVIVPERFWPRQLWEHQSSRVDQGCCITPSSLPV
ncbi:hypothetical protein PG990_007607 [Apiospora arundinis]